MKFPIITKTLSNITIFKNHSQEHFYPVRYPVARGALAAICGQSHPLPPNIGLHGTKSEELRVVQIGEIIKAGEDGFWVTRQVGLAESYAFQIFPKGDDVLLENNGPPFIVVIRRLEKPHVNNIECLKPGEKLEILEKHELNKRQLPAAIGAFGFETVTGIAFISFTLARPLLLVYALYYLLQTLLEIKHCEEQDPALFA